MEERKWNRNAIYSIVCSIIACFIFWWLSIVGLGCGISALKEIKTSNEKGKALAIIGIIIGTIDILLYLCGLVLKLL